MILSLAHCRRCQSGLSRAWITTPIACWTTNSSSFNAFSSKLGLAHVSRRKSGSRTPSSRAAAYMSPNASPACAQPSPDKDQRSCQEPSPAEPSLSSPSRSTKSVYCTSNYSAFRNTASSRLRRSSLLHSRCGLSRRGPGLSSMARNFGIRCSARRVTLIGPARGRTPRRTQHRVHSTWPQSNRSVRALGFANVGVATKNDAASRVAFIASVHTARLNNLRYTCYRAIYY
jgi:hypothetical protein